MNTGNAPRNVVLPDGQHMLVVWFPSLFNLIVNVLNIYTM